MDTNQDIQEKDNNDYNNRRPRIVCSKLLLVIGLALSLFSGGWPLLIMGGYYWLKNLDFTKKYGENGYDIF